MILVRFMLAALMAVAAGNAAAQLYRWKDSAGKVHFTDTPPPASAQDVERKSYAPSGDAPPAGPTSYALQLAAKNFPVTFYSAPGCEPCNLARSLLNARGVPFREVSVASAAAIAELKKNVGSNSVPALVVGKSVQTGFEQGAYERLLDDAGYPKAGILPPGRQAAPAGAPAKDEANGEKPAEETPAEEPPRGPYSPAVLR